MAESKIELMDRLRREGRWPEAEKLKNTMLAEFKARGVKKPSDEAWRLLGVKFPPLPALQPDLDPKPEPGPEPKPEPKPEQDEEVLIERVAPQSGTDLIRDIVWAYENLQNRKATPESAPTLGAWSLLTWARGARNRFFEQVLPKALANKPPDEEENHRQEKKSIEEVRRILARFQAKKKEQVDAQ